MSDWPRSSGRLPEEEHHTPRWVRVSAAIAVVLVVAFLAVHLAGGGMVGHGS
ncbi:MULTISPECIES: hypothetical protein [Streptomyces]|uniref:Uncharacterized protein n=1 Tax=Streptomyces chengmaiensis TaxID=3040919 RepID=A0ABT6HIA1_9ACTN|nr:MULTISPECIES: hypothetical protein [Streptomyces]MDH2388483.1 hypothetical protein [Streptomyces chengmaiensis]WRQ80732.1 hypothetical protein I3F59_015960 [Streptomyces sp. MUM 178J]